MEEVKLFFTDRKNIATLAFLTLMVVILPVVLALIRTQQLYNSQAAGERIQLGTGRCVVERDGKKVLICNEVPINLNAPFDPNVSPSPSASPSPSIAASASPASSPSPSPSAHANATTKFPMSMLTQLQSKLIPQALASDKHICTGDNVPGAGGIVQVTTSGCGEVLNYEALYHSCAPSAIVRYKAPVYNVNLHQWQTIKQDGTVYSEAEMKQRQDPRAPIRISQPGEDPPYINCQVFFEYSGRTDCDVDPQKNAAGVEMGNEGTELEPGQEFNLDVHKAARPDNQGQPDCRKGVQTEAPSQVTNTPRPSASAAATPQPSTTPQPSSSGNPQCSAGLFAQAMIETGNGCGTITALPAIGATSGTITYTAPNVTSDTVCTMKVLTSNNGDCKLDAAGKGSAANPLKPGETLNVNYSNACVDNQPGCSFPMIVSAAAALPTDKSSYKLAESENGLASAQEKGLPAQQFSATYTLKDSTPGMKHIWVEFIDKATGTKTKDTLDVELVENNPVIKSVSCQLDIQKTGINFTISGLRFGTEKGTVSADGGPDVLSWTATEVKGILKSPLLAVGDQVYKFKITRKDNVSSEEVQCRLGITQVSLGTQLLCRGEGKLDLSNVTVTILDENNKKTEETAQITKDGILTGLKTRFEVGKNYTISLKAPKVLRRNITFKAEEGTTVITKDDGTKLQLPVGDIYPNSTSGDGQINTLDQAEINRQWGSTGTGGAANLTADFNADQHVNAFDWSCMRQSFGLSNDPLPGAPSTGSINTEFNENNKITVQFGNPAPNPNVQPISEGSSSGIENEPKVLIEGTVN